MIIPSFAEVDEVDATLLVSPVITPSLAEVEDEGEILPAMGLVFVISPDVLEVAVIDEVKNV